MLALSVLPGGSGRLQGSNLRASDVKIAKPLVYDGNKLTLLVKGKPYIVPPLIAASKDPWVVSPTAILWRDSTPSGLFIRERSQTGVVRALFAANTHLARVQWGEKRVVDYRSTSGASLKAAVILPPNDTPGQCYPTIALVYPQQTFRDLIDYWLDSALPGLYNL